MRDLVPEDRLVVAESGVRDAATIRTWRNAPRASTMGHIRSGCRRARTGGMLCVHEIL
jgi:hypothetical protein